MKPRIEKAIVIGASSGMGRALVEKLAADGCRVAAIARRKDRLDEIARLFPGQVIAFEHDVKDYDSVPALFQCATAALGGLDLVIYASGVMPEVAPTEYCFEKDREMVEVNLLGAIAWLDQAAIRFGNTGHGVILGIGSVAGDRGRSGQPVYNTTKAALATYLEALRNRLAKKGVIVSTVKPGPVATEMTLAAGHRPKMTADKAAEIILAKCLKTGEHYVVPLHRLIFAIIKRVPSWIFRRLSI